MRRKRADHSPRNLGLARPDTGLGGVAGRLRFDRPAARNGHRGRRAARTGSLAKLRARGPRAIRRRAGARSLRPAPIPRLGARRVQPWAARRSGDYPREVPDPRRSRRRPRLLPRRLPGRGMGGRQRGVLRRRVDVPGPPRRQGSGDRDRGARREHNRHGNPVERARVGERDRYKEDATEKGKEPRLAGTRRLPPRLLNRRHPLPVTMGTTTGTTSLVRAVRSGNRRRGRWL